MIDHTKEESDKSVLHIYQNFQVRKLFDNSYNLVMKVRSKKLSVNQCTKQSRYLKVFTLYVSPSCVITRNFLLINVPNNLRI